MESILTVGALLLILAVALLASADAGANFHSFVEGLGSRAWPRRHRRASGLPLPNL